MVKACCGCGQVKPLEEYYKRGKQGIESKCRSCCRARSRAYRAANHEALKVKWRAASVKYRDRHPGHARELHLKRAYGITVAEYESRLRDQHGVCAICERPPGKKRLHVDHAHETNRVRGILCSKCNRGIGNFAHNPKLLQRATAYLDAIS